MNDALSTVVVFISHTADRQAPCWGGADGL